MVGGEGLDQREVGEGDVAGLGMYAGSECAEDEWETGGETCTEEAVIGIDLGFYLLLELI